MDTRQWLADTKRWFDAGLRIPDAILNPDMKLPDGKAGRLPTRVTDCDDDYWAYWGGRAVALAS